MQVVFGVSSERRLSAACRSTRSISSLLSHSAPPPPPPASVPPPLAAQWMVGGLLADCPTFATLSLNLISRQQSLGESVRPSPLGWRSGTSGGIPQVLTCACGGNTEETPRGSARSRKADNNDDNRASLLHFAPFFFCPVDGMCGGRERSEGKDKKMQSGAAPVGSDFREFGSQMRNVAFSK